ncbi:YrzI family small protein [Bacillus sp. Bva_UNVM-123]
MTLNILFFTITIKKRKVTVEEALHNEMVMKIYEENHKQHTTMNHPF